MELSDTTSLFEQNLVVKRDAPGSEEDILGDAGVGDGESAAKSVKSMKGHLGEHVPTTTEIKNINESNDESSLTKNSLLHENSNSKDKEDLCNENGCLDGDTKLQTITFSPSWSESLKSPTHLSGFSPSETGSCHGMGLQLAVERSVSTASFLGNVSSFLSSTATLYEQLGGDLIKIAQLVRPQQLPLESSINNNFQSLYEDIMSLGSAFQSSAQWYDTSIIAPLKEILSTNETKRDAAFKQYRELRQASVEARKSALAHYSKTTEAIKNAEAEIQSWILKLQQKERQGMDEEREEIGGVINITDTGLSWEKSLQLLGKKENEEEACASLILKLKFVQSCRLQYSESVEKENNFVTMSHEKESLALIEAQKSEEDQTNFFVKSIMSQIFPKNENAGNFPVALTNIVMNDIDRPFTEGIEKKGIELLSNFNLFKQQQIPYEVGMGVMDAETLGLPEALGIQRDKMKSSFSGRENRIEVTEIVIKLFEDVANVTSKATFGIRSQIANQRRRDASDGQSSESFRCSTVASIWQTTLNAYEDEAKLISGSSFLISNLEKWINTSQKALGNEIELDNAAWKHVCDAARLEMKLESRYKQTKQHVEKVRQRASSKELLLLQRGSNESSDEVSQSPKKGNDGSASLSFTNRSSSATQSTPNRVGRAFFKGGEAMKKLTENAIVQIAQISKNEADQKEAKDQLALEEASTKKKDAVLAYASCTKERIQKLDSEDVSGWTEMKEIILKLAESIRAFKKVRCTVLQKRISQELESSFQSLIENTKKWSENIRDEIDQSDRAASSTSSPEHALLIRPINSQTVDLLLGMTETEISIPKLKFDLGLTIEEVEVQSISSQEQTGEDAQHNDDSDGGTEKPKKLVVKSSGSNINISEAGEGKPLVPARTYPRAPLKKEECPELKAFVKDFWSRMPTDKKVPTILDTYTCAYRPKERITFLTPTVQGKLYTTKDAIYFVAAGKNIALEWETIESVEKERGFMGSNNENGLVVSYRSRNTIASFLLCRLKYRDDVVANLQRLKAEYEQFKVSQVLERNKSTGAQLPAVPPDSLLKNMEIVLSRTIKNVSIESIFEKVWADRTAGDSFYGSWLKEEECFDINLGEWEIAEPGEYFRNEWCDEKYDQQRLVTFNFNRTTHLYIGPPVAIVKQRHFIRIEENDKCTIAISAEFEGIPYADTFAVEMRWVATRTETNDALVQVGLFVNFKKKTMLKSQIMSGTITETKQVHSRLFNAVKKACANPQDDELDVDDSKNDVVEEDDRSSSTKPNVLSKLGGVRGLIDASTIGIVALLFGGIYFILTIFGNSGQSDIQRLENHIQELRHEVHALHKSIDFVTFLLKDMESKEN